MGKKGVNKGSVFVWKKTSDALLVAGRRSSGVSVTGKEKGGWWSRGTQTLARREITRHRTQRKKGSSGRGEKGGGERKGHVEFFKKREKTVTTEKSNRGRFRRPLADERRFVFMGRPFNERKASDNTSHWKKELRKSNRRTKRGSPKEYLWMRLACREWGRAVVVRGLLPGGVKNFTFTDRASDWGGEARDQQVPLTKRYRGSQYHSSPRRARGPVTGRGGSGMLKTLTISRKLSKRGRERETLFGYLKWRKSAGRSRGPEKKT